MSHLAMLLRVFVSFALMPPRAGDPLPQPHHCTESCTHTCGEAGGRTKRGKKCSKAGGSGRAAEGIRKGSWALCWKHDPKRVQPSKRRNAKGEPIEVIPGTGLSPIEARFVLAYCGPANANATEAAKLAGCGTATSPRHSLSMMGSDILSRPHVRRAIAKQYESLSAPAEEILKRMTDDARLSIAGLIEFVPEDPSKPDSPKRPTLKLTEETLAQYGSLIREIETDPETKRVTKIRLNDSQAARRDLARILKLVSDTPVFVLQTLADSEIEQRLETTRRAIRGPGAAVAERA